MRPAAGTSNEARANHIARLDGTAHYSLQAPEPYLLAR